MGRRGGQKFYAVANGRDTGVYSSWGACEQQVSGYSNAVHKSFSTRAEAEAWLGSNGGGGSGGGGGGGSSYSGGGGGYSSYSGGGGGGGYASYSSGGYSSGRYYGGGSSSGQKRSAHSSSGGGGRSGGGGSTKRARVSHDYDDDDDDDAGTATPYVAVGPARAAAKPASSSHLELFFDGGSRDNPGISGSGSVLYEVKDGRRQAVWSKSKYVGSHNTVNEAEYTGLIEGLQHVADSSGRYQGRELRVYGDSELVVKQLQGDYQVRAENLKPLHTKANDLCRKIAAANVPCSVGHVPRSQNAEADRLANVAMDAKGDREQHH